MAYEHEGDDEVNEDDVVLCASGHQLVKMTPEGRRREELGLQFDDFWQRPQRANPLRMERGRISDDGSKPTTGV